MDENCYNELKDMISELELLHTKLVCTRNSPEEENINKYKLWLKIFDTYHRIINDPEIHLDTIKQIKSSETRLLERKEEPDENMTFNEESLDVINEKEIDDLYVLSDAEEMSDEEQVTRIMSINAIKLEKIINKKNYTIIKINKSAIINSIHVL